MIGATQWAISLGRLDVSTTVMNLGSFRDKPRQGHLYCCKRFVSYLDKSKWDAIKIMNEEPGLSSTPTTPHDWEE